MTSDMRKSKHELAVFREFMAASGLGIVPDSPSNMEPPFPDIRCSFVDDGIVYFELGRILDPEMQRLRLAALRNIGKQVKPDIAKLGLPERDMLRSKLAKGYRTDGAPIEVLLYFDNDNLLVGDVPVFDDFAWHAEYVMKPEFDLAPPNFRRVWVFERHRKTILWQYGRT